MKRSRFSEEQIIGILKEHQAGMTAGELCRKHGISDATFYTWREKYGGLVVSDARRLKALEEENARLTGAAPGRSNAPRRREATCPHPFRRFPAALTPAATSTEIRNPHSHRPWPAGSRMRGFRTPYGTRNPSPSQS